MMSGSFADEYSNRLHADFPNHLRVLNFSPLKTSLSSVIAIGNPMAEEKSDFPNRICISIGDAVPMPADRKHSAILREKSISVLQAKMPNLSKIYLTRQRMRLKPFRADEKTVSLVFCFGDAEKKEADAFRRAGFTVSDFATGQDDAKVLLRIEGLPGDADALSFKQKLIENGVSQGELASGCTVITNRNGVAEFANVTLKRNTLTKLQSTWKSWSKDHRVLLSYKQRVPPVDKVCRKCWRLGHFSSECKEQVRCAFCAATGHQLQEFICKGARKCLLCGEENTHTATQCPLAVWHFIEPGSEKSRQPARQPGRQAAGQYRVQTTWASKAASPSTADDKRMSALESQVQSMKIALDLYRAEDRGIQRKDLLDLERRVDGITLAQDARTIEIVQTEVQKAVQGIHQAMQAMQVSMQMMQANMSAMTERIPAPASAVAPVLPVTVVSPSVMSAAPAPQAAELVHPSGAAYGISVPAASASASEAAGAGQLTPRRGIAQSQSQTSTPERPTKHGPASSQHEWDSTDTNEMPDDDIEQQPQGGKRKKPESAKVLSRSLPASASGSASASASALSASASASVSPSVSAVPHTLATATTPGQASPPSPSSSRTQEPTVTQVNKKGRKKDKKRAR